MCKASLSNPQRQRGAIQSEDDAQEVYEDFVKGANNSIEAKSKEIVSKSEEVGKAEDECVEAKDNDPDVLEVGWSSFGEPQGGWGESST